MKEINLIRENIVNKDLDISKLNTLEDVILVIEKLQISFSFDLNNQAHLESYNKVKHLLK